VLDPTYPERHGGGFPPEQNIQTHSSGHIEQVLEYQFLAALTPELLRRGMRFEVLRGDFDLDGHDIVIEADGIMRHIQLKCMVAGGKARRVPVNTRLGAKPSGCVVWMAYDPASLEITGWRWFGDPRGARLPDMGDKVARHSRGNRDGVKAERPHIRILPIQKFDVVSDAAGLADRLFGSASLVCLRRHLRRAEPQAVGWLERVKAGDFSAIPIDLGWDRSVELAHTISGYDLAEELNLGDPLEYGSRQLEAATRSGSWPGDAAELWITLFLEHRRWRFSSPLDPGAEMEVLLDTLVRQLRVALTGEQP
jgi:hypothetical protein